MAEQDKSHILRASDTGFLVRRTGENETTRWWEDVSELAIASDFSELVVAGLSAINAAVHTATANDPKLISAIHGMPLRPDLYSEILDSVPELSSQTQGPGKVFRIGSTLIYAAEAATILQEASLYAGSTASKGHVTAAGLSVNTITHEVPIPKPDQEAAGSMMNTYPAETFAMRYSRVDGGGGPEKPKKLQFASRLRSSSDEQVSRTVNVSLARDLIGDRSFSEVRVDSGSVRGIFSSTLEVPVSDLGDMASAIKKFSPRRRR